MPPISRWKTAALAACLAFVAPMIQALAQMNFTVSTDDILRAAILAVQDGDTITFSADISLTADLPAVQKSITIDGDGHALSGAQMSHRGLFIAAWEPGTATFLPVAVTVKNLTIHYCGASGGTSRSGSGGGGAGLGGAIFVADKARVSLSNISLSSNDARGGAGSLFGIGSGGGGMGGYAGEANTSSGGGGLGSGASTGDNGSSGKPGIATGAAAGGAGGGNGQTGGASGGGGGRGENPLSVGGGGGVGGASGTTEGGAGGFGGGGGAGGSSNSGGAGGFGGGGGSGATNGGAGGFGGGGGGVRDAAGTPGTGGFGGGNGSILWGGGGAGMGGAIFVMQGGSITFAGPLAINGNAAVGGSGGSKGVNNGSAFGSGIFAQGDGDMIFSPGDGETQTVNDGIADVAGSGGDNGEFSLGKTGAGTLILAGTNTFVGGIGINQGTLLVNGSTSAACAISAPVGATLGGTGTAAGPVILLGTLTADAGALTVGSLDWIAGTFAATLGSAFAPPAITGNLTKSVGGKRTIALADGGVTPGETYTLMTFGSQTGFTTADFAVTGIDGTLLLEANALKFTVRTPPVHGVAVRAAKGRDRAIFTITNTGDTTTRFQVSQMLRITSNRPGAKPPAPSRPSKPPFIIVTTLDGANVSRAIATGTSATLPAGGTATVIVKAASRRPTPYKRVILPIITAVSQADPSKSASAQAKIILRAEK